jgi:hypothetical protein
MFHYASILLSLLSLSIPLDSATIKNHSNSWLASTNNQEVVACETDKKNNGSPDRGTGRRDLSPSSLYLNKVI